MVRGSFERTKKLRNQSVESIPHISIERAQLITEGYKRYEGSVETPVLRALVFKYYMENRSLCINDGELIVGEKGDSPQGAPTYPELCCHTMDDLDIMDERDKIFFKVNDKAKKIHNDLEAYDKKTQLEAMDIACDAIIIYSKRYSEYARELANKETNLNKKEELQI